MMGKEHLSDLLSHISTYHEKRQKCIYELNMTCYVCYLLLTIPDHSYLWYLTNKTSKNPLAYKDLETYYLGANLSGKRFSIIPEDLVKEVTISIEVKVCGGQLRGGYSTSFYAENNFDLNSHIIAELRKELKNKVTLKASSTHK